MRRWLNVHAGVALVCALSGCSSSTEPVSDAPQSVSKLPQSVSYDFSATLQTFDAPDPAAICLVSSCPHKTFTSSGSSLGGTLVFAPAVTGLAGSVQYPVDSLVLSEVDCRLSTSCYSRTVNYHSDGITVVGDSFSHASFSYSAENIYLSSGRMTPDSITGALTWYVYNGVRSQSYGGTFVARRRR